jgi:uncharacterized protein
MDSKLLGILSLTVLFSGAPQTEVHPDLSWAPASGAPGEEHRFAPDTLSLQGSWEGSLAVQGGMALPLRFHFAAEEDGSWGGTMDSPLQGAIGIPMGEVLWEEGGLTLYFPALQARFEGALKAEGEIEGRWMQGGGTLPLTLRRLDPEAPGTFRRPQEPRPPFPYRAEEVRFSNAGAGISLAGTLTLPEGAGPFPAVALITGSGPQDRDETILGHKPFWVIADHLTRKGIAVLRFDDRGVAGSEGDFASATTEDFVTDAAAALAFLRNHSQVNPEATGLIGHSEGGLIAPRLAAKVDRAGEETPSFVVLLGGPALPGGEILKLQAALIARAMGASEAAIQAGQGFQTSMQAILAQEPEAGPRAEALEALLRQSMAGLTPEERAAQGIPAGEEEGWVRAQVAQAGSPWFRWFVLHDPRPDLEALSVPVLALFGELDLQVPPQENAGAMREAFEAGNHPDFTLQILPRLNHLFQTATLGTPAEYATIEETFAPEALQLISDWILRRFPSPRPRQSSEESSGGPAGAGHSDE